MKNDEKIRKSNKKGFTLVELIVVLVILAILAAILVPALLGYIDRAREKELVIEARQAVEATRAITSSKYATEEAVDLSDEATVKEIMDLAEVGGTITKVNTDNWIVNYLEYQTESGVYVTYCPEYQDYPELTGVYTIGQRITYAGGSGEGGGTGGEGGSGNEPPVNPPAGGGFTIADGLDVSDGLKSFLENAWDDGVVTNDKNKNGPFKYKVFEVNGTKYCIATGNDVSPGGMKNAVREIVEGIDENNFICSNNGKIKTDGILKKLSKYTNSDKVIDEMTIDLETGEVTGIKYK